MTTPFAILLALTLTGVGSARAQPVAVENVSPAFPIPAAEGLFRVASAEPLGKGGINVRLLNEAYRITVDKVGEGTSVTGQLGLGIGLSNTVDFSLSVPLLFDIAGGLTKYGTGDVTTALKIGFPGEFPAPVYGGVQFAATFPVGYKDQQALNVRPYSRREREMAGRLLLDINREAVGIRLNAGYVLASDIRPAGVVYGGGVEVGRGQIFTVTAEYWNEPGVTGDRSTRAVFGANMTLWWAQLQAGIEQGFSPDLPDFSGIAGVRFHTSFGRKGRKMRGRVRKVPVQKDLDTAVRVAVVNLQGFEDRKAGEQMAERIRTALTRYSHIRMVEVGEGTAFLDPDAAIRLAREASADIVITGRVLKFELGRSSRPNVPLVVGFPETRAEVEADVRIVDTRERGEVFSASLAGSGRRGRGVRVFPTSSDNRTSYLSAVEQNRVWDQAIDQAVASLLREMAANFPWYTRIG